MMATDKTISQTMRVDEKDTALNMGSGLLPVFSTPSMIAFMENTAMKLINLQPGESSVGISINVNHIKASPVGENVFCEALLIHSEGRKHSFRVKVTNEKGDLIGEGTHERVVVDIERFMGKL